MRAGRRNTWELSDKPEIFRMAPIQLTVSMASSTITRLAVVTASCPPPLFTYFQS